MIFMTLKQFLKPDRRKIVICIILIILEFSWMIFYSSYSATANPCCLKNIPEEIREQCVRVNARCGFTDMTFGYPEIILLLIFAFVFITTNYLLSCLIVWIYNKLRKPRK